jgi:hypothetical protein
MLAGLLGPSTNWRVPFVVMAAPTLLLSLLLVATVTEPPRGGVCAADAASGVLRVRGRSVGAASRPLALPPAPSASEQHTDSSSQPPGFEAALEGHLASGATYEASISWPKVWRILAIRSNWIIILQGLPGCLPWGVLQTYINGGAGPKGLQRVQHAAMRELRVARHE